MTIRFVEDIYADFLFDCYVANLRLTEEDWFYYGKEEHHIEVPKRDGGVLTPLNSQFLTTYQHWVAGVLQSEMLGKCCFAMVPKNTLPPMFEMLRAKWARSHRPPHPSGAAHPRFGKKHSETARKKMSAAKRGKTMPHLLHPSSIEKVRRSKFKPVEVVFGHGARCVYPSAKDAAAALGVTPGSITNWAKGKSKSSLNILVRYL